jgi:hypothetical protein
LINNGNDDTAAIVVAILIFLGILFAVMLAVSIFVSWMLYRANEALPVQHRKSESWQAFLLLIPLFNLIWNFVMLARVSSGMQSFFQAKNDESVGDCGANLGLWYSISCLVACVPYVGCLGALAAVVLLIMYLMKINNLRTRVLAG